MQADLVLHCCCICCSIPWEWETPTAHQEKAEAYQFCKDPLCDCLLGNELYPGKG